jgi:hypothetical protein
LLIKHINPRDRVFLFRLKREPLGADG